MIRFDGVPASRRALIQDLFCKGIELDPADRASFLTRMCGRDADLRDEVADLIESHEHAPDLLEESAAELLAGLSPTDHQESMEGRSLGPYRIDRKIASGGMGEVWLAERIDGEFEKKVAVKVIRRGLDSKEIQRQFHRERQTLARLEHANIARLLDGGTTDDGRPYLVMEYVEGKPIDAYCDEKSLSTRDRLELFREVCSAVDYAHHRLILHRDLKPTNILVTKSGEVKLLDFGVAKLLEPETDGARNNTTVPEFRFMTPEYACPEQLRSEASTIASDVYSLGVILYELLSGRRPHTSQGCSIYELERSIYAGDPVRPSTAITRVEDVIAPDGTTRLKLTPEAVSRKRGLSPQRLRRYLAGDLDSIALKSINQKPGDRYASVEQMSEDIQRHLAGVPIIARNSTLRYRAAKFVTRNKATVAAAFALIVSLMGGIIGTAWQAHLAANERDAARIEARKADQINHFVQEMLAAVDPRRDGRKVTMQEVLDAAAIRVDTELGDEPEIRAAIHATIGQSYAGLGLYDEAETHLGEALELIRGLHGPEHEEVAEMLNNLATAFYAKGDYERAEPFVREALTIQEHLLGDRNAAVAQSLNNLGAIRQARGDLAEAETMIRRAVALRRELLGDESLETAESLNNLGNIIRQKGDLESAVQLARKVLTIRRTHYNSDHPDIAQSLGNLSVILASRGEMEEAEELYRKALSMNRRLLGEDHPDVALGLYNLASLLRMRNDQVGAEPIYRESLDTWRRSLPETHWRIAMGQFALGTCIAAQKRYDEAEPLILESHPIIRETFGDKHPHTRKCLEILIQLYEGWGRPDRAETYREIYTTEFGKPYARSDIGQ